MQQSVRTNTGCFLETFLRKQKVAENLKPYRRTWCKPSQSMISWQFSQIDYLKGKSCLHPMQKGHSHIACSNLSENTHDVFRNLLEIVACVKIDELLWL
jgi:hypothetical protein